MTARVPFLIRASRGPCELLSRESRRTHDTQQRLLRRKRSRDLIRSRRAGPGVEGELVLVGVIFRLSREGVREEAFPGSVPAPPAPETERPIALAVWRWR